MVPNGGRLHGSDVQEASDMDERHSPKDMDGGSAHAGPGAVSGLEADRIDFTLGAVGMARGRDIRIGQAAVGLAVGDEIELRQSSVRLALARESVRLDTAAAATVIGNHVDVGPRTAVAVLVAGHVEGDVRPLLDWRGAAVFGAVFALVGAVVRRGPRKGGSRRRA
jgi:hypothetical protein